MLTITSLQSPGADPIYRQITDYIGRHLNRPIRFVDNRPWAERKQQLLTGQIDFGWVCGLLYVQHTDRLRPMAAPVMAGPRYGERPVYFSDVIVGRKSAYKRFADLRGATWAYNEINSHSGYNLVAARLAQLTTDEPFFGRAVAAGSHLDALQMVVTGRADVAAIDSTVLDWELAQRPTLHHRLRIIESLGPSRMPPWVAASTVDAQTMTAVRDVLLTMNRTAAGPSILAAGQMDRIVPVADADYDSIRTVAAQAAAVTIE